LHWQAGFFCFLEITSMTSGQRYCLHQLPGRILLWEDHPTVATAGNGQVNCVGLHVTTTLNDMTALAPITGRGELASCVLRIPRGRLREVIAMLQAVAATQKQEGAACP
jgi:hypothetical protein